MFQNRYTNVQNGLYQPLLTSFISEDAVEKDLLSEPSSTTSIFFFAHDLLKEQAHMLMVFMWSIKSNTWQPYIIFRGNKIAYFEKINWIKSFHSCSEITSIQHNRSPSLNKCNNSCSCFRLFNPLKPYLAYFYPTCIHFLVLTNSIF